MTSFSKLLRSGGLLLICYSITFLVLNYINGDTQWGSASKVLIHVIAIAVFLFFSGSSSENETTFGMLIWGCLKGFIALVILSLICKAFSLSLPFYYVALGISMIVAGDHE